MRHYPGVKAILLLPIIFSISLCADEPADRTEIVGVIAALNELPQHPELIRAGSDGPGVLQRAWKGKRPVHSERSEHDGKPTVVISHEVWGEATISFHKPVEMLNPKIVSGPIRFITADVALADGFCVYQEAGGGIERTPVLFVMKKDGAAWKIASFRVLASW